MPEGGPGGRLEAMSEDLRQELLELSAAERLELIEELWNSLTEDEVAISLTEEQRTDLEQRLAEADSDPAGGSPWEEVRERIRSRSR